MQTFFQDVVSFASSLSWADVVQSELAVEASKLLATKEAHIAILVTVAFLITSLLIWVIMAIVGVSSLWGNRLSCPAGPARGASRKNLWPARPSGSALLSSAAPSMLAPPPCPASH